MGNQRDENFKEKIILPFKNARKGEDKTAEAREVIILEYISSQKTSSLITRKHHIIKLEI